MVCVGLRRGLTLGGHDDGRSRRRRRRSLGLNGRLVPRSRCRVLSMIRSLSSMSLFVTYPRRRIRSKSGGVVVLGKRSTVNVYADCWPWVVVLYVDTSGRGAVSVSGFSSGATASVVSR